MQIMKQFVRNTATGLVFAMLFTGITYAQDLKSKLPQDPDVVTGKFANGLTYYIRNNHKPAGKVELRLVVKAGSILENNSQQGLAHFMEHMNFNGTKNFPKNELVSFLQTIGVRFGADLNAYTSFDETVYMLPIPTDKPDNLEKGFQIIEDWAHNALLTNQDIDDERGVVLEESRLGQGAQNRMLKKFFPKLAAGSKYADRLPIGKDEILKTFKYDTIRSFYHDWYRPDLQAVVVVGDIDIETAKKMISKHFEGLTNPAKERNRNYLDVTPRKKSEAMVLTDKEETNTVVAIIFPYFKKHDEAIIGDYRDDLIRELALKMINQRFTDLSQSATPPFVQGGADFEGLIHGYEAFQLEALFTNDGGPAKAINALTAELLKVKKFGFTESELERTKQDVLSEIEKMHLEKNTTNSSNYVEEYKSNFLNNEPFPGIDNEYKYNTELMPGIKVAEVNEMLKKWISNQNTFSLIMAPDKKDVKLPTDKELLKMTEDGFKQEVKKDEEKVLPTTLMTKKPTAGKVISQKKEDGIDATTYTLSNGIEVTIKSTDFKSDEILFKGIKKGGTNNYGLADRDNVYFLGSLGGMVPGIIDAMGLGAFNPNDLEKVMSGKKANVDPSMDDKSDILEGSSTIKDFESLLQMTYLYIMEPRKDAELFKAYQDKMKSMMQFAISNPRAAFSDTTVKTLYSNNPLARMVLPRPSDFENINLDRALRIYKDEFGCADGYHFYIVGNIKPETAVPLIETYLGSIPQADKTPNYKDNGVRPVGGNKVLKVTKGKEKQSLILGFYTGETTYSEDLELKTKALAEVLNIKVIEVLREKMGGIYTGGFSGNVSKEPYQRYSVQIQLPCGPENVDKLITAANEQIQLIKDNGPDAKDLDKVKSQWHEKYVTDVKENKYWEASLTNILFWGREKDRVLNYQSYVDKLTPADIQATAKLIFNGTNSFYSILYPEPSKDGGDKH